MTGSKKRTRSTSVNSAAENKRRTVTRVAGKPIQIPTHNARELSSQTHTRRLTSFGKTA
jgi:hypothetical protein